MVINKRYKRNIKQNRSFYICMSLLTMFAVMLNIILNGALSGEKKYLDKFFVDTCIEDGQFITYRKLSDSDIEDLEKKFNLTIEEQKYVDCDISENRKIRLFEQSDKLNKYVISEGEDIVNNDDVILSVGFANACGYKIGDSIEIRDKNYIIKGFFVKVDYLTTFENLTDNFTQTDSFGLAIVNLNEFEKIAKKDIISYYSVLYSDNNSEEFRKYIYDNFQTFRYVRTEANPRVTTAVDTVERMEKVGTAFLPFMLILVILLTGVIIARRVRADEKQIGILSAFGYSKSKIALHYSIFGVIPGVIGSVLGVVLGVAALPKVGAKVFSKFEKLPIDYTLDVKLLLSSLLIPTVVYFIFSFIRVYIIVRKDVILMLRGESGKSVKNKMRMSSLKVSFKTKFKLRLIFGNLSRTLVLLIGICVGSILLVYCYACTDSLHRYVDVSVDEVGSYEYEYFLNSVKKEPIEDAAMLVCGNFEVKDHNDMIMLLGMDSDITYVSLENENGNRVVLEDNKYYISSMGAMMCGVDVGDEITFYDVASIKSYTIKISGIIKNDSQSIVYTSRENACDLLSLEKNSYNVIMSEKMIDFDNDEIAYVVEKENLKEQIECVADAMDMIMWVVLIFGAMICVIVIYLIVNMIVSENQSSISMLKVLGYEDKEINKIMIHVYHGVVIVGIILGLLAGVSVCKANFDASVETYNTYIKTVINCDSIIKYFCLVIVSYVISLLLLRNKVKKADMVESLKDNRE